MPDPDIFEEVVYASASSPAPARDRVLTKGLRIELNDERAEGESVVFQYEGGIVDFVRLPSPEKTRSTAASSSRERDR